MLSVSRPTTTFLGPTVGLRAQIAGCWTLVARLAGIKVCRPENVRLVYAAALRERKPTSGAQKQVVSWIYVHDHFASVFSSTTSFPWMISTLLIGILTIPGPKNPSR
uniref:Uncharacterized protein n=1 Tax=Mycena chlorophos TaxID=658473 RepID=A0ABQ0M4A7_MYCCL|nr:predicted protein [Mycena chlorophos]